LSRKNHDEPIVVVGGGIGGLSAAINLATDGQRVILLEQNAQVGGKMAQWESDGFRFDMGPSVITMPHVFEALFARAGRELREYLQLEPLDPLTRYFYRDGTVLDVTPDLTQMARQIEDIEPHDVEGYFAYLSYIARLYRLTSPTFIFSEPPSWRSFLKFSPADALKIDGLRTMHQAIKGFVKSPHLQQLFGRFATYVGASPYIAPATLNVIAHVELVGGVWYPEGGIYSVARAMEILATELGVEIRTQSPVQEICVQNGRVNGVMLQDGTEIKTRSVVANVDVATVYEKLIAPPHRETERVNQLAERERSCSGFVMLLGVEGEYAQLTHHNIFFSQDYEREFDDIFEREVPPDDPTIYISITSKSNPAHAPTGHENWFVLINAPALSDKYDWDANRDHYRQVVLDKLAAQGIDVRNCIKTERVLTPIELEQMTGARQGALYGASSNSRWAAFRRPHNRAGDIKGLYFAGGTTHPGGGVPMVTLSGKLAAQLVLEDLR